MIRALFKKLPEIILYPFNVVQRPEMFMSQKIDRNIKYRQTRRLMQLPTFLYAMHKKNIFRLRIILMSFLEKTVIRGSNCIN